MKARALVSAALATAIACFLAAGSPGALPPPPRVTMITDSVGGVLYWVNDATAKLAKGLDFHLEARTCRKLVEPGCWAYDQTPPSALDTIHELGPGLGQIVIVDVGYNDVADGYGDKLDTVMKALLDAGVQHVVWVTLEETEDPWVAINPQIRAAPARWPQLVVADWAPVAATHPEWFVDVAHMNSAGGMGLAEFLRPIMLSACGSPCDMIVHPPTPEATLLKPTVGLTSAMVRWRGNDVAATYDLEVKASGGRWRMVAVRTTATSRRVRGAPGRRIQIRVRAWDADSRVGPWSAPQAIRYRAA